MPRKNSQINAGGATLHHVRDGLYSMSAKGVRFVNVTPTGDDLEPGGPVEGRTREECYALYAEVLKRAADRGMEKGVLVCIEPEPTLLIEKGHEYEEFVCKYVKYPGVGLNFDMGHFYCVGEDPAALIRGVGQKAAHFHLEDIAADRVHFHLPPGKGAMDYKAIFAAQCWRTLQAIGWEHAEPVLRSLVFGLLDLQGDTRPRPVGPYDPNLENAAKIRLHRARQALATLLRDGG